MVRLLTYDVRLYVHSGGNMQTTTATNARRHFFEILKGATEEHETYRIQTRKGGVVLLSEEEYEGLLETMELLSTPGFKQSIQRSLHQMEKGETFSMKDIFGDEDK